MKVKDAIFFFFCKMIYAMNKNLKYNTFNNALIDILLPKTER